MNIKICICSFFFQTPLVIRYDLLYFINLKISYILETLEYINGKY